MNSLLCIHVLSLDTVGGVEALYSHYLEKAINAKSSLNYTCVSGKPPHPFFSERFEQLSHKVFLEQYIMGMRLPRLLRFIVNIRRGLIEDIVKPNCWVFWNRMENKPPPGRAVYYEHGAAWNETTDKGRKQFLGHCSSIVANSHAAATMLKQRWDVQLPIDVVPNPLRPDFSIVEKARSMDTGRNIRLGFVGRLVPIKGLFVALHTIKELISRGIPATLDVAGEGELKQAAQVCATRLGIGHLVCWRGCISDISSLYDAIDIMLVPSLREPLGLVALEAAARGVPTVAALVDGLTESVLQNKTGICVPPTLDLEKANEFVIGRHGIPNFVVNPTTQSLAPTKVLDPLHCADAVQRLAENPALYSSFSEAAIEHARSRSDFNGYFQQLQAILGRTATLDQAIQAGTPTTEK